MSRIASIDVALFYGLCEYRRGTLALRRLCTLLDAERVYRELATIFEQETDLEFATTMVQVGFITSRLYIKPKLPEYGILFVLQNLDT